MLLCFALLALCFTLLALYFTLIASDPHLFGHFRDLMLTLVILEEGKAR
jgi:hypothetical protein